MKSLASIAFSLFGLIWMVSGQNSVTISGESIKDTHISSVWNVPYSQNQTLVAAEWTYYGGIHGYGRSLIQFDLSEVPDFSNIEYACLSLYHNPASGHIGHSDMGGDNTGIILRVAESWTDEEVIWNTQPITTNTNWRLIHPPETSDQDYPIIDVTTLVQDMVNHPDVQHGLMIKLLEENALYRSLVFGSVDHPDNALRPALYVEYSDHNEFVDVVNIKPGPDKGKDAYINLVNTSPDGNEESLVASLWTHSGEFGTGRFLIDFQLPELSGDKELVKAELNLYHNPASGHQGHSRMGGSNDIVIQRITEPWEENEVTWYNQPLTTSENEINVNPSNLDNQHYLNVDITKLINDMLANPEEGFGLLVKLSDETALYRIVVFASSDHSNPILWPSLDIFYGSIITNDDPVPAKINCRIVPNPNSGLFKLEFNHSIEESTEVLVYDQYGRLIEKNFINDQITEYNWTDKPGGIYFIRIKTELGYVVEKVIIK